MATYNNLPVYHEGYKFILELFYVTKNFSREYKFSLGESLKKEAIEMMTNFHRANSDFSLRKENIKRARENVEVIRLLLRITKDIRQVSLERFAKINQHLESISRQLTGWDKSLK